MARCTDAGLKKALKMPKVGEWGATAAPKQEPALAGPQLLHEFRVPANFKVAALQPRSWVIGHACVVL